MTDATAGPTRAAGIAATLAHARYVLKWLDRMGIERVHVLGFSMGGGVALELERQAPQRVASVVMLSSIGVQEMELLGQYSLNHVLHGLQLGGLIDLLRAGRLLIDLLECDEVRIGRVDDSGDARQVELPVGALGVVNVVAQHAQPGRWGVAGPGGAGEDQEAEANGQRWTHGVPSAVGGRADISCPEDRIQSREQTTP